MWSSGDVKRIANRRENMRFHSRKCCRWRHHRQNTHQWTIMMPFDSTMWDHKSHYRPDPILCCTRLSCQLCWIEPDGGKNAQNWTRFDLKKIIRNSTHFGIDAIDWENYKEKRERNERIHREFCFERRLIDFCCATRERLRLNIPVNDDLEQELHVINFDYDRIQAMNSESQWWYNYAIQKSEK